LRRHAKGTSGKPGRKKGKIKERRNPATTKEIKEGVKSVGGDSV